MSPTFALDATGGDYAPVEIVLGAVQAIQEYHIRVLLVGPADQLRSELARQKITGSEVARSIEIVHSSEVIAMGEHPAAAVRARRDSPPVVCARLVREGRAAGFVTAGNTGAAMAAALFVNGRLRGIERPALATVFPTIKGRCLLLDVGANADCKPSYLAQFALMGSIYSQRVLGVAKPTVALLNIGEEETKGSQLAVEAHRLLRQLPIDFVGNAEGKDVPFAFADVVVADGFSGNVALKMAEGMGSLAFQLLREEVGRSFFTKLGALALKPALRGVVRRIDYEEYGGAALLGVDGIAIVAHGRSKARAIRSALRVAKQAAEANLVGQIQAGIAAAPVAGAADEPSSRPGDDPTAEDGSDSPGSERGEG